MVLFRDYRKEKAICMFREDTIYSNICHLQLVGYIDVEPTDSES